MTIRLSRLAFCLLAASAALLLSSGTASARPDAANFTWKVKHTIPACVDSNAMARQPNRIKYTFPGTGGSIKNAMILMAPAGTMISASMNMVTLTFDPKVPAGTMVEFTFTTAFGPVLAPGVEYFNDSVAPPGLTPQGGTPPSIETYTVPTLSEWGLIAMGIAFIVAGPMVLRRAGLFA